MIIEDIYGSPEITECIERVIDPRYREDFKQELFLILLEKPCDEIVDVSEGNRFKWFVVRIILNQRRQQRAMYHTKYIDKRTEYDTDKVMYSLPPSEVNTMEERIMREKKEEQLIEELSGIDIKMGNKRFPVYERLVELIVEYGGMREVSRRTGIPIATVSTAVKRVRTHLKKI